MVVMQDSDESLVALVSKVIRQQGLTAFLMRLPTYAIALFDRYSSKIAPGFFTRRFHKLYYYSPRSTWMNTYWLGTPVWKCPMDMWIYQEIIWETKPEVIIETGTARGGSALFFASIFDVIGKGKVVTIDIVDCELSHPRITKIVGDSVSDIVIKQVKQIVGKQTAMVSLDSNHRASHVLKEMELYSEFVSSGNYLVVEDTCINGHPVAPGWGKGPLEAVKQFLRNRTDFEIDRAKEKFLLTSSPRGFLKKKQS
jgi:cephalosporin hydroxylase